MESGFGKGIGGLSARNKIQIDFLPNRYYIVQLKQEVAVLGVMKLIKK